MLNNALKLIRVYHNVSQKQLAADLGISNSYLNEIEKGKKTVTLEVLGRYSSYFKIPKSSLLYFAEQSEALGKRTNPHPIAEKAVKMLDWLNTITAVDQKS